MEIFSSPYIVVPFVSWFIAQATKFAIKASGGDLSWKYFYKSGNMPSSHTAIVTSLMVVLLLLSGVASPEFGIGAVFSLIVIYDALNVRRAVGEQGGVLARLLEISRTPKSEREVIKVREVLGHTPLEVMAGALIGVVSSLLLMYSYWSDEAQDLVNQTTPTERVIYLGFFGLSFLVGLVINRWYGRRQFRKLPTSRRVQRSIRLAVIGPSLLGLFFVWLQYEGMRFFTTKFWIIASLIWVLVGAVIVYIKVISGAKTALAQESQHFNQVKKKLKRARSKKKHKRKK